MIINVCGNLFYTPTYGYIAAAWITVGSEAVVLLLSCVAVFKILSFKS
jgi:O-antigen/teichoic acid export membrane protein